MLADYDFLLHHLFRTHNSAANALSHLPNHNDGSDDNIEVTILKETYFETRAMHDDDSLETCIQAAQHQKTDPVVAKNLAKMPGQWRVDTHSDTWVKDWLYIPKDDALHGDILQTHHNSPLADHPGQHGTQNLVERLFFWPELSHNIHKYVNGCAVYQQNKTSRLPTSMALLQFYLLRTMTTSLLLITPT